MTAPYPFEGSTGFAHCLSCGRYHVIGPCPVPIQPVVFPPAPYATIPPEVVAALDRHMSALEQLAKTMKRIVDTVGELQRQVQILNEHLAQKGTS